MAFYLKDKVRWEAVEPPPQVPLTPPSHLLDLTGEPFAPQIDEPPRRRHFVSTASVN